jgi:hypothetical protein
MWQFKYNETIWISTAWSGVTICLIHSTLAPFSHLCTPQNEFSPSGIEPTNEDFKCEAWVTSTVPVWRIVYKNLIIPQCDQTEEVIFMCQVSHLLILKSCIHYSLKPSQRKRCTCKHHNFKYTFFNKYIMPNCSLYWMNIIYMERFLFLVSFSFWNLRIWHFV